MFFVTAIVSGHSIGTVRVNDSDGDISKELVILKASNLMSSWNSFNDKEVNFEVCSIFKDTPKQIKPIGFVNQLLDKFSQLYVRLPYIRNKVILNNIPKWWKYPIGDFESNSSPNRWQAQHIVNTMHSISVNGCVDVDYVDYSGKRRWRTVTMRWMPHYGVDKFHCDPQWLLSVYCHDCDDRKTLLMSSIHGWRKPVQ